jgi:hypothetical protein
MPIGGPANATTADPQPDQNMSTLAGMSFCMAGITLQKAPVFATKKVY